MVAVWLPFAPVAKMSCGPGFVRKSKASAINERTMLMVPVESPPLAAVLLVRLEAASTVSSITLVSTNQQPDSQSMQVSS